ncbi:lipocalin-like domain-containing protein [Beijerinckia sp. L45]|uniref:lipocalin-like domain-containing protein n=1 Tax=Beijerinckia sp. L45 TaxID=1641855 RepID=UPI00131CFCBB|nr:lipocalin-like domain-containing protein [Beijerinckia sp. L45]
MTADSAISPGEVLSDLGTTFAAYLATIENFYTPDILALMRTVATTSPTPAAVEACYQLLSNWTGSGMNLPLPIPPATGLSFPKDHGEHWDTPIEWRYLACSLSLKGGGHIHAITNIFRKAIATVASASALRDVERQIYSTSRAVTIDLPGKAPVHYSLPVETRSALQGGMEVAGDPLKLVVGDTSLIATTSDVFPIRFHFEAAGDTAVGRPAITFDIEAEAANPLFLQGLDGYIGAPAGQPQAVSWYYYSWPQQPTTGTVIIDGTVHTAASGLTWMDHQWGGYPAPTAATPPGWSGWCWFEFQFDGNRSLTLACSHAGLKGHELPLINPGFGTFVDNGKASLVPAALEVLAYSKSTETDAHYPSDWLIEVGSAQGPLLLVVKPRTVLKNQAMWMGGLTEYSEAAATVTAIGQINGKGVEMAGIGYCEGVGFEDPAEHEARVVAFLTSLLPP